jgi:hypothetical protein
LTRGKRLAWPRTYDWYWRRKEAYLCLKNDAAPQVRVPSVTDSANHRGRCYDSRCYNNRGRRYDYDWPVRATMSIPHPPTPPASQPKKPKCEATEPQARLLGVPTFAGHPMTSDTPGQSAQEA